MEQEEIESKSVALGFTAGLAMQALISRPDYKSYSNSKLAADAFDIAEAMLRELDSRMDALAETEKEEEEEYETEG